MNQSYFNIKILGDGCYVESVDSPEMFMTKGLLRNYKSVTSAAVAIDRFCDKYGISDYKVGIWSSQHQRNVTPQEAQKELENNRAMKSAVDDLNKSFAPAFNEINKLFK